MCDKTCDIHGKDVTYTKKKYNDKFVTKVPKDWIFFIDCDAFFTDFSTSLGDLIATHSAAMASQATASTGQAQFLVAEDPGGINTGVFLIRNLDMVAVRRELLGAMDINMDIHILRRPRSDQEL